jgi:hypothetical protein
MATTRSPLEDAAAANAYAVVVLPTPPFSDAIVIISAGTSVEYLGMATTAPFVNLLRQLARAKDDYRTGALDITWDGGSASLFLVFGQPTHALVETADGGHLEGSEALSALVARLPSRFTLSSWRKVVVRNETLKCTLEELMEPFAQMAGAASPSASGDLAGDVVAGLVVEPEVDFGLEDFPLLPLGPSLWADAAASVVHLDILVPTLPDALVVLTGPKLRAAGIVVRHRLIDAVWVDDEDRVGGQAAAMALIGARDGSVSGYCLESPEIAEALTMLWRFPAAFHGLPAPWIDLDNVLADIERRHRDCALVVTGEHRCVALLSAGRLLGVYTDDERQPAPDRQRLADALSVPGATLTLREHPQARAVERLPEASFHAFVAPAEAVAPAQSPTPGGNPTTAALAPPGPAATAGPSEPAAVPARPPEAATSADGTDPAVSALAVWGHGYMSESTVPEGSTPPKSPRSQSEPLLSVGIHPESAADTPGSAPSMFTDAAPDWEATVPPAEDGSASAFGVLIPGLGPDYEAVKADLIQIGALWLGQDDLAPVADLIRQTKPSIAAFLSTIDAIKALSVPGHEASVVRAMAREMHYHAAEYLSGT